MEKDDYWFLLANLPSARARYAYERNPGLYGVITQDTPDILSCRYSGYEFWKENQAVSDKIGELWSLYQRSSWPRPTIHYPYIGGAFEAKMQTWRPPGD